MFVIFPFLRADYFFNSILMNLLKKFNKYLLENLPLIWQSKVLVLLFSALLMFLAAIVSGYLYTDLEQLAQNQIFFNVVESHYFSFHVVACLLVITIWGIGFYKNNALKHLYPLTLFYFQRLFLVLLLGFSALITSYKGFDLGASVKAKEYYASHDIEKEIEIYNKAFPFLCSTDKGTYDITQRVYPNPFPLKTHTYTKYNLYENDKELKTGDDFSVLKLFLPNETDVYTFSDENEYNLCFFYDAKYLRKACSTVMVVDKVYNLSHMKLSANDLYNFSVIGYSKPKFSNSIFNSYYRNYDRFKGSKVYKKNLAADVHAIIAAKNINEITQRVEALKIVFSSYSLKHDLETPVLTRYLSIKKFAHLEQITDDFSTYSRSRYLGNEDKTITHSLERKKIAMLGINSDEQFIRIMELPLADNSDVSLLFPREDFENTIDNYYRISSYSFFSGPLDTSTYPALIFALMLCITLLWMSITKMLSFVLSVVSTGVICILTVVIYLLSPLRNSETELVYVFVGLCIFFIVFYLLSLSVLRIRKFILDILVNIAAFATVAFSPIILVQIIDETKFSINYACNNYHYYKPYEWLENPIYFYIALIVSILLFLGTIKRWRGKAE